MLLILRVHPTHHGPLAPTFHIGSEEIDPHLVIDRHLLWLREHSASTIRCSDLGSGFLDRLVGVARQTRIHLTELRQLGNIGFISRFGVLRLDLERLLKRLCTKQLFAGALRAELDSLFDRG